MTEPILVRHYRFAEWEGATLGTWVLPSDLWVPGEPKTFAVLEPPWCANQRDVSCIPVGDYTLVPHECPTHGATWRIWGGVVGDFEGAARSEVEPHVGNWLHQTKGCPLPGYYFGRSNGQLCVTRSQDAMDALRRLLPRDQVLRLRIRNLGDLAAAELPKGAG